jgi:eukaryotic-like serine/threonine-protein kinase
VEELAQEESRALRDAASYLDEEKVAQTELLRAEANAEEAKTRANTAERDRTATRAIYEQCGAAVALVEVKRHSLKAKEAKRATRELTGRDLRGQIEELRGQLARYAEALEEDLASGREKIAARTREGLDFEERFDGATRVIIAQLKGKPECRELLNTFMATGHGGQPSSPGDAASPPRTLAEAS